jgi:hypothetical protein
VDLDDVRVIQAREAADLGEEPLAKLRIAEQVGERELDHDLAPIEIAVAREVDAAHAALAQAALDLITPVEGATGEVHARPAQRSSPVRAQNSSRAPAVNLCDSKSERPSTVS